MRRELLSDLAGMASPSIFAIVERQQLHSKRTPAGLRQEPSDHAESNTRRMIIHLPRGHLPLYPWIPCRPLPSSVSCGFLCRSLGATNRHPRTTMWKSNEARRFNVEILRCT